MARLQDVEIFKVGEHTDSAGITRQWTEVDLQKIADQYNNQPAEERHIAPLTLGHPLDNSPSLGWVEKLTAKGNSLFADFYDVADTFVEQLQKGLYKTRSMALYPNGMLRHVGWLGAQPPAVKGLAEVKFSEGIFAGLRLTAFSEKDEYVTFSERADRAQKYSISVKEKGYDVLPAQYADLTEDSFADPVNLRFPMTREYFPSVLGTWGREDVRNEYSEEERGIITARLVKNATALGFRLNDQTWARTITNDAPKASNGAAAHKESANESANESTKTNAFVDVHPSELSKKQLEKIVTTRIEPASNTNNSLSQPSAAVTPASANHQETMTMPEELLKQMFEELLAFASTTFGEDTANGLSAKIAELQEKYKTMAADQPQPAAAEPAPAAGGTALAENKSSEFAEMAAKIARLERNELLANVGAFTERMIQEGHLLPAQRNNAVELMIGLNNRGELAFSENNKQVQKPMLDAFQSFVASLKQMDFSETATSANAGLQKGSSFSEGVNGEADKLAKATFEFMEEQAKAGKTMNFREALNIVERKTMEGR